MLFSFFMAMLKKMVAGYLEDWPKNLWIKRDVAWNEAEYETIHKVVVKSSTRAIKTVVF